MRGRDEHRTSSLCGVSTFLNKLSPAQHAYFFFKKSEHPFTNCKVKIIAYADPDCCFFAGGRNNTRVNTCIPKQTYIPVICQDARAHVCVFVGVYVGRPEPHSPPLDPYKLDTCDLFVLLCHMLGMSSIRVKFSGLLYIHARFQRGRGAESFEVSI